MVVSALGCVGLGLIWGWLVGNLEGRVHRPVATGIAISMGTMLMALEVLLFTGWSMTLFFLGAAIFALLLHLGWHQQLREWQRHKLLD